jgi:SAM-dependent methyltransferase
MQLPNVLRPFWNRIRPASRAGEKRAREISKIGPAQRWRGLQQDEIKFWEELLGSDQAQRAARMNAERPFQAYLMRLIEAPADRVEILDVGAGPMTFLGHKWPGCEIHITAIDPNAAEYDRILAKLGITPPCRTKFGYVEDLASVVPMSFFDLVHARNCIDHSKDPVRAIDEMVHAVKPGGCVFLNHYISEGRRNDYGGPHQWNLFPRDEHLYVDRPGMDAVDIGQRLRGIAEVSIGSGLHGAESFTATIRRHKEDRIHDVVERP